MTITLLEKAHHSGLMKGRDGHPAPIMLFIKATEPFPWWDNDAEKTLNRHLLDCASCRDVLEKIKAL